jgi:hypothetical protein
VTQAKTIGELKRELARQAEEALDEYTESKRRCVREVICMYRPVVWLAFVAAEAFAWCASRRFRWWR